MVQPNTADMYSLDTLIYIVYAAGQVAYNHPLVGILGRRQWHSASWCDSHKAWNTDTGRRGGIPTHPTPMELNSLSHYHC